MAGESSQGGDGSQPTPAPAPAPEPTPAPSGGGSPEPSPQPDSSSFASQMYNRGSEAGQAQLAKDLGFKSVDAMREHFEKNSGQPTPEEAQRLQETSAELDRVRSENERLQTEAQQIRLESKVDASLARVGARGAALGEFLRAYDVTIDEKGLITISEPGKKMPLSLDGKRVATLEEVVEDFKKSDQYSYLFAPDLSDGSGQSRQSAHLSTGSGAPDGDGPKNDPELLKDPKYLAALEATGLLGKFLLDEQLTADELKRVDAMRQSDT